MASKNLASTIAVAVVSYGRPMEVVACIEAVAQSTYADFEIATVENAGADAFDRLCRLCDERYDRAAGAGIADPARAGPAALRWNVYRLPGGQNLTVIQPRENLGYGGAVNLMVRCLDRTANWRGVWILNPDAEPEPSALGAVVAHAEAGDYGLVGCRLVFFDNGHVQMRGGQWRPMMARGRSIGHGEPGDVPADPAEVEKHLEWVVGAAAYATRAFIEAVGPLNEAYFLYYEDVDWSLRRGPFRLGYADAAVVRHRYGTSIGSAARIRDRSDLAIYLESRNSLLLTRVHFPALYPGAVAITGVLLADFLVRGGCRAFVAACRGWWAGVRGETGRPASFRRLTHPGPGADQPDPAPSPRRRG